MWALLRQLLKYEPGTKFSQWLFDRLYDNWGKIALAIGGGIGVSFAAIRDWVWNLGPTEWCLAFFAGTILTLICIWLYEIGAERAQRRRIMRRFEARPPAVNIFQREFRDSRISISDFYSYFMIANHGKTFNNCEMTGPGAIVLPNSQLLPQTRFTSCEFIVNRPGAQISSATIFENCRFIDTHFVNVSIIIDMEMLQAIRQVPGLANVNVITYEAPNVPRQVPELGGGAAA